MKPIREKSMDEDIFAIAFDVYTAKGFYDETSLEKSIINALMDIPDIIEVPIMEIIELNSSSSNNEDIFAVNFDLSVEEGIYDRISLRNAIRDVVINIDGIYDVGYIQVSPYTRLK